MDSHKLTQTETVNLAQNRPLWKLLATSGSAHSWTCLPQADLGSSNFVVDH